MSESWHKTIRKHLGRIVLLLNILSAIALWGCCLSTWLHPAVYPRLALVGLAFPVCLLICLSFIIVWAFVDYRRIWIPIVVIVPCTGYILDYCPASFSGSEVPDGCLKIVTWNTSNFGTEWEDKEEGKRLTIEYLENCDADIICLQESGIWKDVINDFTNHMESTGYTFDRSNGTMLFSRLPVLQSETVDYETHVENGARCNNSKWYMLLAGSDTILLVNNHLESNRLKRDIKKKYVETLDKPEYEGIRESGHSIGSRLKKSTSLRGYQTDSLVNLVQRFDNLPTILCGDFNDTPISYTYQRLSKVLKNAYRESGTGIGLSYNQKGFWVRIDHIFMSDDWKSYDTHIDNSIRTSDHYPLVSWLKLH